MENPIPPEHPRQRRLRCVHFHRAMRLEDGGIVRAVLDWCKMLADRGHDVTLLTSDAQDVPAAWKAGSAGFPRIMQIPAPRFGSSITPEVKSVLVGADILHLHQPWETANLPLSRWAIDLDVPYIVSLHGTLDDWSLRRKWLKKSIFLALVGRRFLSHAAAVHCSAQAELDQCARLLRPGSGVVIPLLVDLEPYAALNGPELAMEQFPALQNSEPHLLFLSRLHPKKGAELLIEATAILNHTGTPVRLVLAGPGDPRYVAGLRRLVEDRGLSDRTLFTGMVAGALKVSLYQAAAAFVLPTSQENFGIVLIEALAAGMPVVTTRGVDIWPELQAAGAAISNRTPQAIADAIRKVLPDREQLGRRGRQWVFNQFGQNLAEAYESLYARLAGK